MTLSAEQRAELRERLAAIEHERWADWQRWVHGMLIRVNLGNTYVRYIPEGQWAEWDRQIATPYDELSERERESDREQVDRYWPHIAALLDQIESLEAEVYRLDAPNRELREILDKYGNSCCTGGCSKCRPDLGPAEAAT